MDDTLLIVGDNPVRRDFAAFASRSGRRVLTEPAETARQVVLFLGLRPPQLDASALAGKQHFDCICLVSSFRVHFGDRRAQAIEQQALARLRPLTERVVVFRPSPILSPASRAMARLRALWFLYPLVPRRFRGCCVEGDELFAAIEQELAGSRPRRQATYTLLGPNEPWRDRLRQHRVGLLRHGLFLITMLLGMLGVGYLLGLFYRLAAWLMPRLRVWNYDTLSPESPRELLTLYNKYNFRHLKVVGYNNGVVHFGHTFPGKTILSTVRCNRVARVHGNVATFDAGVTIKLAAEVLAAVGKEFYVSPNYSYVSLGTAFFVPIHGSASEFCTMGDTIDRVLLYDPKEDRLVSARRDDPAFGHYYYNLDHDLLLLRLRFRVKDKSQYYRQVMQLEGASSQEILNVFTDPEASNVEVRKSRGNSKQVEVSRYYTQARAGNDPALLFPRDSLGKLWDRLEENAITSFLFHWMVRRLGFHVELFLRADDFARFWETHAQLPVAKIQLRYIKRDGYPHSPFREHDCVSADLFMWRKHRHTFEAYCKETFRALQLNPGKHSS